MSTSGVIYCATNSISCLIASFVSGFFIDLDHFFDYYLHQGIDLRLANFIDWCEESKFKYLILILHSLEYIILLWLIIFIFKLGVFWIAIAVGLSQHMFFDLVFNQKKLKTQYFYFLTLRILKNFQIKPFQHRLPQK